MECNVVRNMLRIFERILKNQQRVDYINMRERWPRLFEQQSQFYKCMPALGLSCHG